uniref:Homeobox domain-containing protein n=1 Tax=Panagrolaimus sp. PS1159 TaxID=55785 RepID=A0AC35GF10_9BILA
MSAITTTFQGFLQSSLEASTFNASFNGEPTLQQMAALSAYSKVAMIAQKEQKFFTPTIYSYMASVVLSNPYPPVYYADRFYPLREINICASTTNNGNRIISDNDEDTKDFDTSTCSEEDKLDTLQISFQEVPDKTVKSSRKISSTNKPKLLSPTNPAPTPKSKREHKLPQRFVSEDLQIDEKEAEVPDKNEDSDDDGDDVGPPVLQKIETAHLETKINKKSVKNKSSAAKISPDGFKHPKKSITIEKLNVPQLVPHGFFKSQELSDPTEPLEEWFLSNLTNPFPSPKQFNDLQYCTNFGHLDIRQWFQIRRKIFTRQNPKSRPWSKKSVSSKRSSTSSDENGENKMMSGIVTKKQKTVKIEVSELEAF